MPSHRTGLLVIRAWLEKGSAEPLRAQVRVTGDISTGIDRTLTLVRPDDVGDLVDTWIHGIVGATQPTTKRASTFETALRRAQESSGRDEGAGR